MSTLSHVRSRPVAQGLGLLAVIAVTAGLWYAWMGWTPTDSDFHTWQVAGCLISLIVLLVGAQLLGVRPWLAGPALVVTFTVVWTMWAARADDDGLFVIGSMMVFMGMGIGTALIAGATSLIQYNRSRRARA
jgi:hypothetical protein